MTGCHCYATFSYRHEPCVKSIGNTYFCGGAHAWTIFTLLFTPIVIKVICTVKQLGFPGLLDFLELKLWGGEGEGGGTQKGKKGKFFHRFKLFQLW